MAPPMVAFFHLLQFLPLLFCEICSYLLVRFHPNLSNAVAGVTSHLLQLCGRFIDDGRNFRHLFGRQTRQWIAELRLFFRLASAKNEAQQKQQSNAAFRSHGFQNRKLTTTPESLSRICVSAMGCLPAWTSARTNQGQQERQTLIRREKRIW